VGVTAMALEDRLCCLLRYVCDCGCLVWCSFVVFGGLVMVEGFSEIGRTRIEE
jgi:hypothetical protein